MMPRTVAVFKGLALGVLALLGVGACRSEVIEPPVDALVTPESVLELAQSYLASGPAAVVIEARATQYSDRGGLKGRLEVLVERPGRVRLTGLSPTDDMVSVLATDGERFVAYQRGATSCQVGRACPSNVGRFASLPLESDELGGVLLGRPPLVARESMKLLWDRAAGAYLLELTGGAAALGLDRGQVQRLWVAHADGRILRTTLAEGGKTRVDVRYSDFGTVSGHLIPRRLDIQLERDQTDLRLDFRDIEVPADLDDAAFHFSCPAGTILEELPCGAGDFP